MVMKRGDREKICPQDFGSRRVLQKIEDLQQQVDMDEVEAGFKDQHKK